MTKPRLSPTERLLAEPGWTVQQFSPYHFRINGLIDVWPRNQRWVPADRRQKSREYFDMAELRQIVRQASEKAAEMEAKRVAVIAEPLRPKVEPPQLTDDEWRSMFAVR